MAKIKTIFVCQTCGAQYPRWTGQCGGCGAWNTLVEEMQEKTTSHQARSRGEKSSILFSQVELIKGAKKRFSTGVGELDRVLGAEKNEQGMVAGAVMLIGGEPGIGKSTLLTQVVLHELESAVVDGDTRPVIYVCGEESPSQIVLRINRLVEKEQGKKHPRTYLDALLFVTTTDIDIVATIISEEKPRLVIVDSIQTVSTENLSGGAGSVGQVRYCTEVVTTLAKKYSFPTFLVGHVTKDGHIAGPKVLEHIVDSVIEISGERTGELRLLRAVKNRFGATDEVGVLQLTEYGFYSVENASNFFVEHQDQSVPGSVCTCVLEGTRPLALEVQALVVKSPLAMPRRVGRGVELSRLQVITAVLQKYCRMPFDEYDIFVSLAGGYTTKEPALDLAIALALVSSLKNKGVPAQTAVMGEVGLLGEVRSIQLAERRAKELKRLGFQQVLLPGEYKTVQSVLKQLEIL